MSVGIIVILITVLGYVSNTLNWRYLNYKVVQVFYFAGAFVHEMSHAVICVLTGARIEEFKVFSRQPHVLHRSSRLPLLGNAIISFAPIAGGLFFIWAVNTYLFGGYFSIPQFSGWAGILASLASFLKQLDLSQWQSWVMIFLSFNMGMMLGPSPRDLWNAWPILLVLLFVKSVFFINLGMLAVYLILVNIFIQLIFILVLMDNEMIVDTPSWWFI